MIVPIKTKLLVTTQPKFELDAASEIWHCLYKVGIPEDDIEVYFIRKRFKLVAGIIAISFNSDPLKIIPKIREYLKRHPWILRYTHRIVPVEYVTDNIDDMIFRVSKLANKRLSIDSKWRITINKRATKISSRTLIEKIANLIARGKVSLTNYEWIINIEIIGDTFLVAVIPRDFILLKKEFFKPIKERKVLEYLHEYH